MSDSKPRVKPRTLLLLLALQFAGCSGAGRQPPVASAHPSAPVLATIGGQIFITTRSQEVLRLALVDVVAVPETDLPAFTQRATASAELIASAAADLAKAQKLLDANHAQQASARELYANSLSQAGGVEYLERWKNSQDAERPVRRQFAQALAALKAACEVSPLPSIGVLHPAASATTNADGRFELRDLTDGREYLVSAQAAREVVGKTERYYWLERVVVKAPTVELLLNNRNLLGPDSSTVKLSLCDR